MPKIGGWPSDSANRLASQFAAKNYFAGEHSGLRLVLKQGAFIACAFGTASR
jgi:phosphatidylinositol 4-kinase